ncbi:hypothetical protein [Streptomyces sp. NPDC093111]|uniref:hypothetical protein n=1 Tax=Streptomyces sp. NPDC093111 TaxID=3154978 RepID=UPI00343645DC
MTAHVLRMRPEGRLQCTRCRAAFLDRDNAARSRFTCPGGPLAHGLIGRREHVLYPTWSKDRSCSAWGCPDPDPSHAWHGPDPFCDETTCSLCLHDCDCDVCEGLVHAPGLYRLVDSREA